MAEIFIRHETKKDFRIVEKLLQEAFEKTSPLPYEHVLVYQLRKSADYLPEFSFVAEIDNKIVGYISGSRGFIKNSDGDLLGPTLFLRPVGVLPQFQKQGVGKKLINEVIKEAKFREYKHIFVNGEAKYFQQFGFIRAAKINCQSKEEKNHKNFLGLVFNKEDLLNFEGEFFHSPIFKIVPEEEVIKFNNLLNQAIAHPHQINKLAANINTVFLWVSLLLGVLFIILRSANLMSKYANLGAFLLCIGASVFGIGNARMLGRAKTSGIIAYILAMITVGFAIYMFF